MWNYRVVEHDENLPQSNSYFAIHEVYYCTKTKKVKAYSENHIAPMGDDLEDITKELKYMLEATKKPVLKMTELKEMFSSSKRKENG